MKKATKAWLMAAAFLVFIGCILFAAVMSTLQWDFTKLSTVKYETNIHEIAEPFSSVAMTTDTADIIFALSDNGTCSVECYEEENAKHSVAVENGALVIKPCVQKSWYDYIGFHFGSPSVTVYLPETAYASLLINENIGNIEMPKAFTFNDVDISLRTGDVNFYASVTETLKIKTSTGNIYAENISAGALDLSVTTGKATVSNVRCAGDVTIGVSTGKACLTDISCKNVLSSGSTGDIFLDHVIAAEKFSIERSTGKVKFIGSDAAEILVKTNTGDVTGSLLTGKVFIAQTNTGRVDVPKAVDGGRCEITTGTGNITITIQQ